MIDGVEAFLGGKIIPVKKYCTPIKLVDKTICKMPFKLFFNMDKVKPFHVSHLLPSTDT